MRKIIVTLLATLALLFGATLAAAPAHAVTGSTAYFSASRYGGDIRVWNTSNSLYYLTPGRALNNARQVCPQSNFHHIWYLRPGETSWRKLANGVCFYPQVRGTYTIVQDY